MSALVTELPQRTDDDLFDGRAHYVDKTDWERALFDGHLVPTLCGHKVTARNDVHGLPVCVECKELWEQYPDDEEAA